MLLSKNGKQFAEQHRIRPWETGLADFSSVKQHRLQMNQMSYKNNNNQQEKILNDMSALIVKKKLPLGSKAITLLFLSDLSRYCV